MFSVDSAMYLVEEITSSVFIEFGDPIGGGGGRVLLKGRICRLVSVAFHVFNVECC